MIFLLLSQFPLSLGEFFQAIAIVKLEILHVRPLPLLLSLCISSVCFHSTGIPHLITIIFINVILGTLPLTRTHVNKYSALLLVTIVFSTKFKSVNGSIVNITCQRETSKVVLRISLHLGLNLFSFLLPLGNQGINVFIRISSLLSGYDLISTKLDHLHQLVFAQFRVLLRQSALLDNSSVEEELPVRPFNNFLFHRPFRDESEHLHGLGLTKAMGTIHCL
mmetsp:Transcript_10908/g.16452  ORF Transcript_10908/g.16452 Transcript_10908/m.16452 type:complete len:221 (+) Transcript_10908:3489-4151(+)